MLPQSVILSLINKYTVAENYLTYDPYDIWKTKLGLYIKRNYYKFPKFLMPIGGLLTFVDLYLNNKLRLFYHEQEYPIVRALATLSLVNMYKSTHNEKYLYYSEQNINWLIKNVDKSNTGYGWGLGFVWPVSQNIIYNNKTPFSTHTPYGLEAVLSLNKINGKDYSDVFLNVFNFFENDLKIVYEGNDELAISYGPYKDRIAINATSYAMYTYALLSNSFVNDKAEYLKSKAIKFYNFVVNTQGEYGEWDYMAFSENTFIDCFHSCFILQNLKKTKNIFPEIISDRIIQKGWNYIKTNFYDPKYRLYKRFSKKNKGGIIMFDLYDNAEVLNTALLLNDHEIIESLVPAIFNNFYSKGQFYSAITYSRKRVNLNTLRWAVMPFIYSLSNYLLYNNVRHSWEC